LTSLSGLIRSQRHPDSRRRGYFIEHSGEQGKLARTVLMGAKEGNLFGLPTVQLEKFSFNYYFNHRLHHSKKLIWKIRCGKIK
jgi:hypothetical protein